MLSQIKILNFTFFKHKHFQIFVTGVIFVVVETNDFFFKQIFFAHSVKIFDHQLTNLVIALIIE